MNIYFAQMTTDMPEGSSHFWGYLPYSVGCIWAYAQTNSLIKEKYTAKEFLVMKEDPDQLVANLESPKVFCFSDYVWNHTLLPHCLKNLQGSLWLLTLSAGADQGVVSDCVGNHGLLLHCTKKVKGLL